jgi:hypothetical protein
MFISSLISCRYYGTTGQRDWNFTDFFKSAQGSDAVPSQLTQLLEVQRPFTAP